MVFAVADTKFLSIQQLSNELLLNYEMCVYLPLMNATGLLADESFAEYVEPTNN